MNKSGEAIHSYKKAAEINPDYALAYNNACWMDTSMSASLDGKQSGDGELQYRIPLRRPAVPDELVPAIVFLLSDDAGYIDATCLAIDGGWMGY